MRRVASVELKFRGKWGTIGEFINALSPSLKWAYMQSSTSHPK